MTQIITTPQTSPMQGAAYMILAGTLFAGINTLVQSATMQFGQISTTVAFWQYFIALLFSIPWVLPRLRSALRTAKLRCPIFGSSGRLGTKSRTVKTQEKGPPESDPNL